MVFLVVAEVDTGVVEFVGIGTFLGTGGGRGLEIIAAVSFFVVPCRFFDETSSPLLPEGGGFWPLPPPHFAPPTPPPVAHPMLPLTCTLFPNGGEGLDDTSTAEFAAIPLSFPDVSKSDVSLEKGAVERSDSNFRLVQRLSLPGLGTFNEW